MPFRSVSVHADQSLLATQHIRVTENRAQPGHGARKPSEELPTHPDLCNGQQHCIVKEEDAALSTA